MRTKIITIGNSRGIRIPKILLEESGIINAVEIKISGGELKISPLPSKTPIAETTLLAEKSLKKDWERPEEDLAWKNL